MLDFFQCKPSSKKINTSLLDITIWILQNNVLGANWSLLQKCKWKHEFEHLQHSKINQLAKLLCWMKFRPDLKADHDLYPGHMQFLNDKGGRSCVLWPQGDSVQYPEWPQLSRWLWGSVCLRPWGMAEERFVPALHMLSYCCKPLWCLLWSQNISMLHSDRAFLWVPCLCLLI